MKDGERGYWRASMGWRRSEMVWREVNVIRKGKEYRKNNCGAKLK